MTPTLPEQAEMMRQTVRELASDGMAAELGVGAETLAYVDVYDTSGGAVVHVVHYGEGRPEGFRARVGGWLGVRRARVHSPYLAGSGGDPERAGMSAHPAMTTVSGGIELLADDEGWFELPCDWGRYCALELMR
ncbi:MAG: hypothetical protein ABFD96_00710, partial [Armatimonadia bacterium]